MGVAGVATGVGGELLNQYVDFKIDEAKANVQLIKQIEVARKLMEVSARELIALSLSVKDLDGDPQAFMEDLIKIFDKRLAALGGDKEATEHFQALGMDPKLLHETGLSFMNQYAAAVKNGGLTAESYLRQSDISPLTAQTLGQQGGQLSHNAQSKMPEAKREEAEIIIEFATGAWFGGGKGLPDEMPLEQLTQQKTGGGYNHTWEQFMDPRLQKQLEALQNSKSAYVKPELPTYRGKLDSAPSNLALPPSPTQNSDINLNVTPDAAGDGTSENAAPVNAAPTSTMSNNGASGSTPASPFKEASANLKGFSPAALEALAGNSSAAAQGDSDVPSSFMPGAATVSADFSPASATSSSQGFDELLDVLRPVPDTLTRGQACLEDIRGILGGLQNLNPIWQSPATLGTAGSAVFTNNTDGRTTNVTNEVHIEVQIPPGCRPEDYVTALERAQENTWTMLVAQAQSGVAL